LLRYPVTTGSMTYFADNGRAAWPHAAAVG
jgi:hypothetical protein